MNINGNPVSDNCCTRMKWKEYEIHMMTGSNNLEPYYFAEITDKLMNIAGRLFNKLGCSPEYVDIGGGYGIPYQEDEEPLNVDTTAQLISEVLKEKCAKYNLPEPTLKLEPGRYFVADAGYLLTRVIGILPETGRTMVYNGLTALFGSLTLVQLARSVALLPHDRTREQRSRQRNEFAFLTVKWCWIPPIIACSACGLQLTFWEHSVAATGEMLNLLFFAYCIRCLLEYRGQWMGTLAIPDPGQRSARGPRFRSGCRRALFWQ